MLLFALPLPLIYCFLFSFLLCSATQTLGQRAAGASTTAAAPVRTMPQYKYAAGVRNPQQHMASQPQVPMQQVRDEPLIKAGKTEKTSATYICNSVMCFYSCALTSHLLSHSAGCPCPRSRAPDCIHAGICPSSGTEADAGSVGYGLRLIFKKSYV